MALGYTCLGILDFAVCMLVVVKAGTVDTGSCAIAHKPRLVEFLVLGRRDDSSLN